MRGRNICRGNRGYRRAGERITNAKVQEGRAEYGLFLVKYLWKGEVFEKAEESFSPRRVHAGFVEADSRHQPV